MIELYHCPDARSFRCLWALEALGLDYTLHRMSFPPRIHSLDFLALNPAGTVPLLTDGPEVWIIESAAALQYIATKNGPSALSIEPGQPGYAAWLNWLHFGEATLTTALSSVLRYAVFEPEEKRLPAVAGWYSELFLDRLQLVDRALDGQAFLSGARFTVADISVGYALQLARFVGLDKKFPARVAEYWARLQALDSYRAARAAQKPPAA
jgi:glutathione S-transferase